MLERRHVYIDAPYIPGTGRYGSAFVLCEFGSHKIRYVSLRLDRALHNLKYGVFLGAERHWTHGLGPGQRRARPEVNDQV